MSFPIFYDQHLCPIEGGYVNDPPDAGGETWFGVSSRFLARIGRKGPLTKAQARDVLQAHFWDDRGLDGFAPVAAWCYCDARVNHSETAAARLLQHALGVRADGQVGPITRAAAAQVDDALDFVGRYRRRRIRLYCQIVARNPSQSRFLVGWLERIHHLNDAMLIAGIFDDVVFRHWCNRTAEPE